MKKHFVVLSNRRCGSTPVLQMLSYYFASLHSHQSLGEYFNLNNRDPIWTSGSIQYSGTPRDSAEAQWLTENRDLFKDLIARRLKLIAESDRSYVFKLFSNTKSMPVYEYLSESADVLVLRRKNTLEEYLSLMLSLATGKWYGENGLGLANKSVLGHKEDAQTFFEDMKSLKEACLQYTFTQQVFFEDVISQAPSDFLKSRGLTKNIDWSNLKLVQVQNPPDKLALFCNPQEVKSWYDQLSEKYSKWN